MTEDLVNRIYEYIENFEDGYEIVYSDGSEIILENGSETITIYFKTKTRSIDNAK